MNKDKVYIIAEAGVNHNGDINIALELIKNAKKIGVDCIKFQTFKTEKIVSKSSPKASYQLEVTDKKESQYEMLKKLELSYSEFKILKDECDRLCIDFLSTPYSFEDVDTLNKLNVNAFKIASGQLTELPFLRYVAKFNKPIILSTGMANISNIFDAVNCIREHNNNEITVLQCTTNYPSKIEDANIRSMNSIKYSCNVDIGYSDHVPNNFACFAAVSLGAKIIEKHFTLDKNMIGPDHSSSLNVKEFEELIYGIRNIESALGSSIKKPSSVEIKNSYGMKRSLVVNKDLKSGNIITKDDIEFKRPLNGLEPNYYDIILGKKLAFNIKKDSPIQLKDIIW